VAHAGGFAANRLRYFAFRAHPQRPLMLIHILISGAGSVNQARSLIKIITIVAFVPGSQAIQWFALKPACKDFL
jgi:hypothetical protein